MPEPDEMLQLLFLIKLTVSAPSAEFLSGDNNKTGIKITGDRKIAHWERGDPFRVSS